MDPCIVINACFLLRIFNWFPLPLACSSIYIWHPPQPPPAGHFSNVTLSRTPSLIILSLLSFCLFSYNLMLIWLYRTVPHYIVSWEIPTHESQDFYLLSSLLYVQCLEQSLVHSRRFIKTWKVN